MNKVNINIGPGEKPEVMNCVVSWEFEIKLKEATKFLRTLQEHNIITMLADAMAKVSEKEE